MTQEKNNKKVSHSIQIKKEEGKIPQEPKVPLHGSEEEFPHGIEVPEGYVLAMTETGQHILVPEGPVYQDNFCLISEAFEPENVKNIELPKFLLKKHSNSTQSFKEKSTVLITLRSDIDAIRSGMFKKVYKAAKKDQIKLEMVWLDEEDEPISTWSFTGARICGVDLGTASLVEREEEGGTTIEIEYENLCVDGCEF